MSIRFQILKLKLKPTQSYWKEQDIWYILHIVYFPCIVCGVICSLQYII